MTAPAALSAMIPARNASATLGARLEAVAAPAGADVEVIVVDDAWQYAASVRPPDRGRLGALRGRGGRSVEVAPPVW